MSKKQMVGKTHAQPLRPIRSPKFKLLVALSLADKSPPVCDPTKRNRAMSDGQAPTQFRLDENTVRKTCFNVDPTEC
jgi:hypothetical protein